MRYLPHNMLVTGGAGFIGTNFIRQMLMVYPDIKIINLDLLTYAGSLDNLKNLPNEHHHHFYQGDICDALTVSKLLREHSIDTIVHFAAESHVDRSITNPDAFINTNILGTFTLLESARTYWLEEKKLTQEACRFHHISTDEVFGSLTKQDPPFTENSQYLPNSPYSASKAGSDHLVRAYFHTYGLPITTSHCSNNYGPYQHSEKFIPTIIHSCMQQKRIPIYGDGSNIRDWLFVDDHCRAIIKILEQGKIGRTYNIGGNNEWTNMAIAMHICQLMDQRRPSPTSHQSLLNFVEDRKGHDFRYAIDANRMQSELHWQPEETFETGIEKTVDFYLKTGF